VTILSPERWKELSAHIDQALSLPEGERTPWLESIRAEDPALAGELQLLLEAHQVATRDGFLTGIPMQPPGSGGLTGQQAGAYRLVSIIGRGGMGAVWLAERCDGRFERKAAVKFINLGFVGQGAEERFKQEGAILARLAHPNIAELLDAGVTASGQPYIILEYVEGEPVDRYCDQHKLDLKARITLFLDVLGAVAHAHANLIVHRDLKPSNVFVSKEGQVKLLDFGIAKLLEGEGQLTDVRLTRAGDSPLTPEYAAPEQITGAPITTATDVYALGILLYQLLTGRHPAEDALRSPAALVKAIVDTEPLRPSTSVEAAVQESDAATVNAAINAANRASTPDRLSRLLRGDLDTIVGKALKKKPQERYASPADLAEDLRRYLRYEPISARPDTILYRTGKFVRRNGVAVALTAVALAALGAGLGVALWQAHVARQQSRVATAVQNFLVGIFAANGSNQPDPVKARQTPARELLDIGARNIDSELADVPEARFNILGTLARMYQDLGLDDQAVALQRKRVDLARARFGNNSLELAESLVSLGSALWASHGPQGQEQVLLEAKDILDRRRDFRSKLRGTVSNLLGQQYQSSDVKQGLVYAQQAVEVQRQNPDDPDLLESLYTEASILNYLNRQQEAEPLMTEAVRASIKQNGDPNQQLPRFCSFQAELQWPLMEFAAAEENFRHAARAAQKVNGDNHVDTMETELRLGSFLAATARTTEGLQHIERARQILLRTRGEDDPFYAPQVFLVYGGALADAGRLEEGLAYTEKAVTNRRKNRPGTQYLGKMLEQEAWELIQLGRYGEAERLVEEAGAIAAKVGAPQSYLGARDRAWLLADAGRSADAEAALKQFHPALLQGGATSLDSLRLGATEAETAFASGDAEAALRSAEQVNGVLSNSAGRAYMKGTEARATLIMGQAELLRGQPSTALPLLQKTVELRESILDPISPELASARVALASCYFDLGQPAQASALLAQARKALASHRELGHQYTRPLKELEGRMHKAVRS